MCCPAEVLANSSRESTESGRSCKTRFTQNHEDFLTFVGTLEIWTFEAVIFLTRLRESDSRVGRERPAWDCYRDFQKPEEPLIFIVTNS